MAPCFAGQNGLFSCSMSFRLPGGIWRWHESQRRCPDSLLDPYFFSIHVTMLGSSKYMNSVTTTTRKMQNNPGCRWRSTNVFLKSETRLSQMHRGEVETWGLFWCLPILVRIIFSACYCRSAALLEMPFLQGGTLMAAFSGGWQFHREK